MFFNTRYFKTSFFNIRLVSLVLLAAFVVCQIALAFGRLPSPDDAMFLSVPKNWLNGYGWATSYSEKIPFNPDFTGPTALLLPAALLIKLFGNQLWIAGITGALVNLMLLACCLRQIHLYWRNQPIAMLALVCGVIASLPEDFSTMNGYSSGSLLFVLACLIAFNPHYNIVRRALLTGLLAGFGLLTKVLLLPAFCILAAVLLFQNTLQNTLQKKSAMVLAAIALPLFLIVGSWQLYRQQQLATFTPEFVTAHSQYGKDFLLYHGSGIGQWMEAGNKWLHLSRNASRNLYYLEDALAVYGLRNPFLGQEPADVHHVVGWIFIAGLILLSLVSIIRLFKNPSNMIDWMTSTVTVTTLAYIFWFLLFAMAMSPGHLYFPIQWSLWILLLTASRCANNQNNLRTIAIALFIAVLSFGLLLSIDGRNAISLSGMRADNDENILQAADYIQKTTFKAPLVGCGYSGYPRHLEYVLPASQNFADCLDMIEDHVKKDEQRYQWAAPLSFNIVLSLQSLGSNPATDIVLQACKEHIQYRNNDVIILQCGFAELQTIPLDKLMDEIQKTHRWYKTRLKPL